MIRMFDRSRRLRLLLVVLVMSSVTIITLDYRSDGDGPLDSIGHLTMTVLAPIQHGLVVIFRPVGSFFAGFTKVPSLKARISTLQRENAVLRSQQNEVTDLTRENASLRALLSVRERFNLRTTSAQVIGVSPSNFEKVIIIDRGSRQGVRKDMPVISGDGLVGRVTSVSPSTAEVVLLLDRASAVAARLASNGETGVLEGNGSGSLTLELLDPNAKVALGDKVVTSGYDGGLFPPGVPLGTVTDAPPANSNLSRKVTVQPFVDFSSLDYVLLVTGEKR
jgi:rod shape-determining protein MreC